MIISNNDIACCENEREGKLLIDKLKGTAQHSQTIASSSPFSVIVSVIFTFFSSSSPACPETIQREIKVEAKVKVD
jgi:hypothetical protein